jgi:hypothetical protein
MKMKKCLVVAVLFFVVSGVLCLCWAYELKKESDWFCELSDEWHLFESNYTEDIKNIDRLRNDLRWHKELSLEWERFAMEFKHEALDWKMKYKEQYTINNVGLLSNVK